MKLISSCDCNLCCEGTLPGVGSHLFSEFLIKETINREGKAAVTGKHSKGNELLFTLTPLESAQIFIGRQSTEAGLSALGKKEFTDEEIEELQSQDIELIDWNLVCGRCEKLFQLVEDKFKEIYDAILRDSKDGNQEYEIAAEDQIWFELFLNLNLWRASASEKFNFKFEENVQTCLTELMHQVFIVDIDNRNYDAKFRVAKKQYDCISIITFFDKTVIENPTKINENFIFPFHSSNPYFIAVNRLLLCISPNNFDGIGLPAICQGVLDDLLKFIPEGKAKVFFVTREQMTKLGENYAKIFVDIFAQHLMETYSIGFSNMLNRLPTKAELQELIDATKSHIGEFYDPKKSDKEIFKIMGRLVASKLA